MAERFECAVAIPAHNCMPDVLEAVQSALAQTHPPAEVVLIDDRSTDGTAEALAKRFGGRLRIIAGHFGSAASARNAAWRASSAPWVAFLDADDVWFPDKLAVAAQTLAAAPEATWFFSDSEMVTIGGNVEPSWIGLWADLEEPYLGSPVAELFEVNFLVTSAVVVRREALAALGGFREDMSHAEDADLWIRLARSGLAAASKRALLRCKQRETGLSRQLNARLEGNAALYRRLADDDSLPSSLRRAARRRVALDYHKLALAALRDGRTAEARAALRGAWLFPERALPFATLWGAAHLPASWVSRLRRERWVKSGVASPMSRHRRVVIRSTRTR